MNEYEKFNFVEKIRTTKDRINDYKNQISELQTCLRERVASKHHIEMRDNEISSYQGKIADLEDEIATLRLSLSGLDEDTLIEKVKTKIEAATQLKDKILDSKALVYRILNLKDPIKVINKPEFEAPLNNKVKVHVIDGFSTNEELTESTFNHPELNDKITKSSLGKKLEADDHAAHVCGIISKISNDSCVFGLESLSRDYNEVKIEDAKIVNMSIGAKNYNSERDFTLLFNENPNAIFIKSLGNESTNINEEHWIKYISVFQNRLILVGNLMSDGVTLSPSSNIPGDNEMTQMVTVVAPGTDIESTVPILSQERFKELYPEKEYNDSGYEKMSGTSMAAPFVTGLAAALMNHYPNLTIYQIVNVIREGCNQCAAPHLVGRGVIDYAKSFELAETLSSELDAVNSLALTGESMTELEFTL